MADKITTDEFVTFVPRDGIPVRLARYGGTFVRVARYGGKTVTVSNHEGEAISVNREDELPEEIKEILGY